MQYRPGTGYLGILDGEAYFLPFTRSIDDQALLEFTNNQLKIWVDDALVEQTDSVSTALPSDMAQATWIKSTGATVVGTTMELSERTTGDAAYAFTTATVSAADDTLEHSIDIVVSTAPVTVHIGTSDYVGDSGTTDATTADKLVESGQNFLTTVTVGMTVHNTTDDTYTIVTAVDSNTQLSLADDIMVSGETYVIVNAFSDDLYTGVLLPGTHHLVVIPDPNDGGATNLEITFSTSEAYGAIVDSCDIGSTGELALTTTVATADLSSLRMAQINDICFMTYDNGQHFQIERRGIKSWSIVDFRSDDGPFQPINITDIKLTASALTGGTDATPVTLTASRAFFPDDPVGMLYKLSSAGQLVEKTFTAAAQVSTPSIKVTGVDASRKFAVQRTVTGSWATTRITLQSSVDDTTWTNVKDYSGNGTDNYNDGLDNQTIYYRLEMTVKDASTTNVITSMTFAGGSIEGVCRVISVDTAKTVMNVQVLSPFGSTDATDNWYESSWGGNRDFPTAVESFEGRLWLGGNANLWGSVSDSYTSFDREVTGDSASIYRTIAFKSASSIHWISEAIRLTVGITTDEVTVRSSSFNEIITPDNANLKSGTNQGAAPIDCASIDGSLYFVQRSLRKVIRMDYNSSTDGSSAIDLMTLNEDICKGSDSAGIKRIFITRQPETRLWVVLNDGEVRVYVIDQAEDVAAWSRISTADSTASGTDTITDVVALPGLTDDRVYFVVKRGSAYFLEKLALIEDARGGAISYHADSYQFEAGPIQTVTLSHLTASTDIVKAWSAGVDLGEFTLDGSKQIDLGASYSDVTIGLEITADYTSNKLSGFAPYSVLNERERVYKLGMIARNAQTGLMQFGPSFDDLEDMPKTEGTVTRSLTTAYAEYDFTPFLFNGSYNTDSRVYLRAKGPCTVLALNYVIKESKNKTGN